MMNVYNRRREQSSVPDVPDDTGVAVADAPSVQGVPVSAKTLPHRQQERVREAIAAMAKDARTQGDLARELSVTQQTISNVLRGGPIGVKLTRAVASARAQTFEELVEGKAPPRQFRELDRWDESAAAVVAERRAPSFAVRAVSRWPMFLQVSAAEPRLIVDLCALWLQWSPLELRRAAELGASLAPDPIAPAAGEQMTPAAGTQRVVPVFSERRPKQGGEK